ncbi:spore gernimation protein GerPD [Peribacillus sp. NPDC096540]|uniref:spore gernimation protein GerPD n=1 Tax=Peribacillus sp. NPDC096540 TaxID=3390612 RepID=UPI003CFE82AE
MEFNVTNHQLCVGDVKITGVASSALFLIGDVQTIQLSSAFDTPPESLIVTPFVIAPKG